MQYGGGVYTLLFFEQNTVMMGMAANRRVSATDHQLIIGELRFIT